MTTPAVEIPGYVAGTWDLDPVHSHIGFVGRTGTAWPKVGRDDIWPRGTGAQALSTMLPDHICSGHLGGP